MFKKYDQEIIKILEGKETKTDWKEILKRHKLMLIRIRHERLIHLLVTIFVGICFVLSFLAAIITYNILLSILTLILMILFAAYIFHYRFLENTTQKWYGVEDEIEKRVN